MKIRISSLLFLSLSLLVSCQNDQNPISQSGPIQTTQGALSLSFDKLNTPKEAVTVIATLTREGYSTQSRTMNLISDSSAEISFQAVEVGMWQLKVNVYSNSNTLIYFGETNVSVVDGQITSVTLVLQPASSGVGSVNIFVSWGSSNSLIKFIDYEKNPVLRPNSTIGIRGVSQPQLISEGSKLMMYYQQVSSPSTIGMAISIDGKTWESNQSAVLAPTIGSWDEGGIVPGPIMLKDSIFTMYYQGQRVGVFNTGIASSTDGIHWTKPQNNLFKINNAAVHHVSDIIFFHNKYYMYFDGFEVNSNKRAIYLAVSNDGVIYQQVQSDPILKSVYPWEINGITFSSIIEDGGKLVAIYSDNGSQTNNFGFATSLDGLNWTRNSSPIFSQSHTFNNWANAGISYPNLVKMNDGMRCYYMGAIGVAYDRNIGFAYLK